MIESKFCRMLGWIALAITLLAPGALAQTTAPTTGSSLPIEQKVAVRSFKYEGNTKITDAELNAAVADLLKKDRLSMEDLEEARQRLTMVYVNKGYINSGAVIPDQNIENGVVRFTIVEGKLNSIDLKGNKRLHGSYIKSRIWRDDNEPLNILTLKNNLELLRLNPNLKAINAELKPGLAPGQATLDASVTENQPFQLGLEFDNKRSPSVGAERFSLLASDSNVTGVSDSISLKWGLNTGGLTDMEWAGTKDIAVNYTRPINSRDTTIIFDFSNTDSPVVQDPFTSLKINSRTESFGLTIRHPFYRTTDSEFAMFLTLSRRYNKTFLAGEPFSFSPGAHDGESNVAVIRFGQEYNRRTTNDALAIRSTFNFGVQALGSTINSDSVPDSQFFDWLFQAQYVRRIFKTDSQVVFRLATQLTDDPLLSLEQFAIGGMDTVRGYRENELVRDNGIVASAELRIPIWKKAEQNILTFAPFVDCGFGWNVRSGGTTVPPDKLLSSAGIGFIFTPNRHVNAQIYWGFPFNNVDVSGHNIQDEGIHFDVVIYGF